jgi:outer membrane protein with beta-barrel domain
MKLRPVMFAVAGAIALHAPVWAADEPLALQKIALDPVAVAIAPEAPVPSVALMSGAAEAAPSIATVFRSVRWQPRRWRDRDQENNRWSSHSGPTGFSQLHAGFYDPDGSEASNSFLIGGRGGIGTDEHLQFGLGLDWVHKSERNSALVSSVDLPGGGSSERRVELARSSSNLFPVMAYAQFSPGSASGVTPYFGVGGGYEALFLSAEDFTSGDKFDATYGGWGWQAWAGVSMPVSGNTHLSAEVFRNQSSVERDVNDNTGNYREVVDLDGLGMRFGLNWGF